MQPASRTGVPSAGPSTSGRGSVGRTPQQHRHRRHVVARALFDPPPFRPDKLTVLYQEPGGLGRRDDGQGGHDAGLSPLNRRYTLTHNDLTGDLTLTVGTEFNYAQISGLYTRLLRDEVVAEWHFTGSRPSLHVYCHVSGEERWLAPPPLRNYIFRRELPLVLDTFVYADRELLEQRPELRDAEVYVHFQSCQQELDTVEVWGILGERSSWQPVPTSVLKRVFMALMGQAAPPLPEAQQQQQGRESAASDDQVAMGTVVPQYGPGRPVLVPVVAALDVQTGRGERSSGRCVDDLITNTVLVPPDNAGQPTPSLVPRDTPLPLSELQQPPLVLCISSQQQDSSSAAGPPGDGASRKVPVNGAGGPQLTQQPQVVTTQACGPSGLGGHPGRSVGAGRSEPPPSFAGRGVLQPAGSALSKGRRKR